VDWDVHHGNGTQNLLYDDEDVLYFSTHRYDNGFFYPGTGHVKDTGNGFNVNVPLNVSTDEGHGDRQYLLIWKDILLPMVREFAPDIVLISAGFDACIGDPLGGMRITPPCYGVMTRLLLNECSNVVVMLEGGYNLDTMPRAILCCHYALLQGPTKEGSYDVEDFYSEFKSNIEDAETFHKWMKDYGDLLVEQDYGRYIRERQQREKEEEDANPIIARLKRKVWTNVKEDEFSVHSECVKSVKLVLEHHRKYWKFADEILKGYGDKEEDTNDDDVDEQQVLKFDDWIDVHAAAIKKRVQDMSMFFIQIGTLKKENHVEWVNLVHEWNMQRKIHGMDDFEAVWKWLAQKLNVETIDTEKNESVPVTKDDDGDSSPSQGNDKAPVGGVVL